VFANHPCSGFQSLQLKIGMVAFFLSPVYQHLPFYNIFALTQIIAQATEAWSQFNHFFC